MDYQHEHDKRPCKVCIPRAYRVHGKQLQRAIFK